MKPVAQIFLWYAVISCLLLTITSLVLGRPDSKLPIEILQQPRTSFQDEACRAIFESRKLASVTKPVMLILGASAAQEAYRPHLLESMIPEYSVNNLALGGANITEIRQVLALALKHTPPDVLKKSVLLLPICYPMFVTNEVRWNLPSVVPPAAIAAKLSLTDITREAMRSSPVCDPDHAFFRRAPGWLLGATKSRYAVFLQMAPYLPTSAVDKVLGWKLWRLQLPAQKERRLKQESDALARATPPAPIPSPSDKLAWGRWQMTELGRWMRMGAPKGGIANEQLDELTKLMETASATHLPVLVIDLPLPSWHRAESAYFAPYQSSLREIMAPYISSGQAKLITIVDKIPDDEFQDCGHPTPDSAEHWCHILLESMGMPHAKSSMH